MQFREKLLVQVIVDISNILEGIHITLNINVYN